METVTGSQATFVLVHGSRHGGWCWQRVARSLQQGGHVVYAPTLTGLGERSHLTSPLVNLSTHIQDVVGVLTWEDLSDVILVGHSYGGMVITGVVEHTDRVSRLVYFDAMLPEGGESTLDVLPAEHAAAIRQAVRDQGYGWFQPPAKTAAAYGVTDPDDAAWMTARLTSQPAATYTEPVSSSTAAKRLPGTYIACMTPGDDKPPNLSRARAMQRAAADPSFDYVEWEAAHDVMVSDPGKVVATLDSIASHTLHSGPD